MGLRIRGRVDQDADQKADWECRATTAGEGFVSGCKGGIGEGGWAGMRWDGMEGNEDRSGKVV